MDYLAAIGLDETLSGKQGDSSLSPSIGVKPFAHYSTTRF